MTVFENPVCIVVVNWNGKDDTLACLQSAASAPGVGRVIVVDNGSQDDSVSAIRQRYPAVVIIETGANLGFGAANNIGAQYFLHDTLCRYLLLLNNDAVLRPHALERLIAAVEAETDAGVAAPKILYYPPPTARLWYAGGTIDWKQGSCKHRGFGMPDEGQFDTPERVSFAPGGALLLKRPVVEATGLFDERYFMFEEDVDLSIRTVKAGFGILYVPDAVVWHRVGSSVNKRGNAFIWYYLVRNRLYTMSRHANLRHWLAFLAYFPLLWVWKAAYYSAHGQFAVPKAMVRACFDFLAGRMGQTL